MATPERTEIAPTQEFFLNAPELTNFCQFMGTLVEDTTVMVFESGDRVVKGRIAVRRNGAAGADYVNLDDFEEDWYGGHRTSALENAKKGALVAVSGEFRKDSSTKGGQRRYFDKIRVRWVKVGEGAEQRSAEQVAAQRLIG